MLDNKKYTGNRMKDLNVAEVGQVTEIKGDNYTITSLNNPSIKLKCLKLKNLQINLKDIVLVLFTNSDFRLNLNKIKNNQVTQKIEDENLHSKNFGIIIGSI